ncbi:nucleotidyltransferase [Methanocella sp. MCL-LM]|uniref:nucleotidyltransferase n=1 Tax=Methanocella sp. MCL-LM TaxID=3412035 RepID=UPI003C74F71A
MISDNNFRIYREAAAVMEANNVPYVVGGGIAVMAFGRLRDTKDIDFYILADHQDLALHHLANAGYEVDHMRDVGWLAKAFKEGLTIDFILENVGGLQTDQETLSRGTRRMIGKYEFTIMSPEDLIIRKIMAMRSDRNDWFDCISVLSRSYMYFDWDYYYRLAKRVNLERALSFLLYVRSDREHVVPVPDDVIIRMSKSLPCHK